jgi:hypothetical protein
MLQGSHICGSGPGGTTDLAPREAKDPSWRTKLDRLHSPRPSWGVGCLRGLTLQLVTLDVDDRLPTRIFRCLHGKRMLILLILLLSGFPLVTKNRWPRPSRFGSLPTELGAYLYVHMLSPSAVRLQLASFPNYFNYQNTVSIVQLTYNTEHLSKMAIMKSHVMLRT